MYLREYFFRSKIIQPVQYKKKKLKNWNSDEMIDKLFFIKLVQSGSKTLSA